MKFALAILLVVAVSHGSAKPTISSTLKASLQAGPVDIMVIMKSQTSQVLTQIQQQNFVNQDVKATTLYNELNKFTSASQREVLDILATKRSGKVEGFYITNKISVAQATPEVIDALRLREDIAEIREAKVIQLEKTLATKIEAVGPKVLEWGVSNVNAPAVWDKGFTGKGIVVSSIDTGVRRTHNSLADNHRADYGWFDPYSGTPASADSQGHGTHTMGTIAGKDGMGVAPDAQWIACLGCAPNGCTEAALVGCGQWTFCPNLNGDNSTADCTKRPHLSSNSWGGGNDDTFYNDVINSWKAVGVHAIFAIGNSGPGCRSANSPGDQPNVISVGATDSSNQVASFSSHGPSLINQRIKPEISGPGVNVRSAGHLGDAAFATMSGTSMATPHVAGIVALLLEKTPTATLEQLASALEETALRPPLSQVVCTGGGVDPDNPWPNNSYGWGKVDASKAVDVV